LYINAKYQIPNFKSPTIPSAGASTPPRQGGEAPDFAKASSGKPRGSSNKRGASPPDKGEYPAKRGEGVGVDFIEGYQTIDIRLEKYKEDFTTIDNACDCYLCLNHTKSYLRHLFAAGEPLATRLASMHNLRFYLNLMAKIRTAIQYDYFDEMVRNYRDYTPPASS